MYQYPTCDMQFVHRKRLVDFWDFFRNSLHVSAKNVLQIFFFNLVERKVQQTRMCVVQVFPFDREEQPLNKNCGKLSFTV